MKTVKLSARSKPLVDLVERARRENLILESPDGRRFILAEIKALDRKIELVRQNKELTEWLGRRAAAPVKLPTAPKKRR